MIKEFKMNTTTYKGFIGVAIFAIVATVVVYVWLNMIATMFIVFAVFSGALAFWGKDRVLITMHEEYLEAKEAIAAKKKLIRYRDIDKVEVHKTGKLITLYMKGDGDKKERIVLNTIEKSERKEFIALINAKII